MDDSQLFAAMNISLPFRGINVIPSAGLLLEILPAAMYLYPIVITVSPPRVRATMFPLPPDQKLLQPNSRIGLPF